MDATIFATVFQYDGDDGYQRLCYHLGLDKPRQCPPRTVHVWTFSGNLADENAEKLIKRFQKSRQTTRLKFLKELHASTREKREKLIAKFIAG